MVKVKLLSAYYLAAWAMLLFYWAIDPEVWLVGIIAGLFFHLVVCSVILHKYFTHRTFKVHRSVHYVMLYLGSLGLNGSVLAWSNMHRLHHATSDRKGDPHDPRTIGLLSSLFVLKGKEYSENHNLTLNLKNCKDLIEDRSIVFFHKYLIEIITATYILIGYVSIQVLFVLLIATAVSFIGLFFTTYVYHFDIPLLHYRNHNTKDNSYNNWLTTILFSGEAYHNNHHNDPSNYDTAEKWFEFDLSSLIINLIKRE